MASDPIFNINRPLRERTRIALSAEGPFAKGRREFHERPSQIAYAEEAADAIEKEGTLIAEAGTGTGKTFAYLTPALLAGKRVIISTAGKPLQDQLFRKDLPILRKTLGITFDAALLKGRANYICHHHLERTKGEEYLPERDSFDKLRKIERFAKISQTGDRAELPDVPDNDPLWPMVTSTVESCLGIKDCPFADECFLRRARERAKCAQIVVVNHHLYLSAMTMEEGAEGMLPSVDLTVMDEAHQLPSIATDFFATSFSTREIELAMERIQDRGIAEAADCADWRKLRIRMNSAISALRVSLESAGLETRDKKSIAAMPLFPRIVPAFLGLLKEMATVSKALGNAKERDEELAAAAKTWDRILLEAESWRPFMTVPEDFPFPPTEDEEVLALREEAMTPKEVPASVDLSPVPGVPSVRWLESYASGTRFTNTPLSVAGAFAEMKNRVGGAWIFTSATLSAGGDFKHFRGQLGLPEETPAFSWPSPFNYWEQGCFYLPELPAPANNTKEHTQRVVECVWPLIEAAGGRTFLLCTSLAAVDYAAELLRARLEANGNRYPLFVQGDKPKGALIEAFREAGNGILVGSMSFWEGVDVQGESLSLVVIDKLPFASPDDPISAAKSEWLRQKGVHPFAAMTLPSAVIALKQGAGRLIRSETDRGMFVLCDVRVTQKGYGKIVLASLPDFFRTRRREKALSFFLQPDRYREGLYSG